MLQSKYYKCTIVLDSIYISLFNCRFAVIYDCFTDYYSSWKADRNDGVESMAIFQDGNRRRLNEIYPIEQKTSSYTQPHTFIENTKNCKIKKWGVAIRSPVDTCSHVILIYKYQIPSQFELLFCAPGLGFPNIWNLYSYRILAYYIKWNDSLISFELGFDLDFQFALKIRVLSDQ